MVIVVTAAVSQVPIAWLNAWAFSNTGKTHDSTRAVWHNVDACPRSLRLGLGTESPKLWGWSCSLLAIVVTAAMFQALASELPMARLNEWAF